MVIKLLDHVTNCSTYSEGEVIYRLIHPKIKAGQDVTLSFEGILSTPSAFINGAIVRLLEDVPVTDVKRHLKIVNSTRQINALIRQRFAFAEAQTAAGH